MNKEKFLKKHKNHRFGDRINGFCGQTAEDLLEQVRQNPFATHPDEYFFFCYHRLDPDAILEEFSPQELADILDIELETPE